MVLIKVRIVSKAVNDPYTRIHGLAIDEDLMNNFWVVQRDTIIGYGTRGFTYEKQVDISTGRHTVSYGVSTYSSGEKNKYWDAQIFINDKLVVEGAVWRDKPLIASFIVLPKGKVLSLKIPLLGTALLKIPPVLKKLRRK